MNFRAAILSVVLFCAGCASKFEAPHDATVSTAPGAPGYILVGLATKSYRHDLGHGTEAMSMTINRDGGAGVAVERFGCGSMQGAYGSKPCNLSKLEYQVLTVPPADWMPVYLVEGLNAWGTKKVLRDRLPQGTPVHVASGEIVYIGDFTLASDFDAQEIKLAAHDRDDSAAANALAAYPGLKASQIIYRDPTVRQ